MKLAARDDGTALIGISPGTRNDVKFDFPVNVDIDSGSVGGPSAGLAFTLGVIDALTPGELTGGAKVASTGTISLDGTVGPIGGMKQKVATVERAGAKVFLVPASEADDARAAVGKSDLKIVPVENVDDALKALAAIGGNGGDLVSTAAERIASASAHRLVDCSDGLRRCVPPPRGGDRSAAASQLRHLLDGRARLEHRHVDPGGHGPVRDLQDDGQRGVGRVSRASASSSPACSWGRGREPSRTGSIAGGCCSITQTALVVLRARAVGDVGSRRAQPGALVAVVFATGVISAFNVPSWQAFVSELVPKEDLLNAVTLNSAQFNAARAIGPALGGVILATLGPSWSFLLNAISYFAVIGAVWLVRVPVRRRGSHGPPRAEGLRRRVPLCARSRRHPHGIMLVFAVAFLANPMLQLSRGVRRQRVRRGRGRPRTAHRRVRHRGRCRDATRLVVERDVRTALGSSRCRSRGSP